MAKDKKKKSSEKFQRKQELKAQMSQPFAPITNILQGINRRSRTMIQTNCFDKKFKDLYTLLANPNLLIQAYGNIQRNKGSLTPGISPETIDEMSLNKINKISQDIKQKKYKFHKLRSKVDRKTKILQTW
jgi:hypothetical protein